MGDLVTERLVLHPLSVGEARRLAAGERAAADRWAPGYPTQGDAAGARRFLEVYDEFGDPGPFRSYEIRRRDDGEAIGGIDFHGPVDADHAVTIGYGLVPAARGHGFATEALRALLALARAEGVARVKGDADSDNVASQRVMTAAGMHLATETARLRFYEIAWPDGANP